MRISIVVYSHTGHTLSVARELERRLAADGHTVDLEMLETIRPLRMGDTTAELSSFPTVDDYDLVLFACPVRGGTPAPPMRVYLERMASLEDKGVICLVTGAMPFNWGRKQALAQMRELCEAKGARVLNTDSVWWPGPNRKRRISQVIERIRHDL